MAVVINRLQSNFNITADFDILSAAGYTDVVDVFGAKNHSVQITTTLNAGTIAVNWYGSIDGTNFIALESANVDMSGNTSAILKFQNVKLRYIKCRFVSGTGKVKFNYLGGI